MEILSLWEIINWMEDEQKLGNRIKASKLYKLFYKYAKLRYPNSSEHCFINYKNYRW
jgi:hypothetical protein